METFGKKTYRKIIKQQYVKIRNVFTVDGNTFMIADNIISYNKVED